MNIEIIIGDGDKRAPDIVDELCTMDSCGIKRGKNFLTENGLDVIEYDLEVAPLETIPAPGSPVILQDSSLGKSFTAKMTGYVLTYSGMNGNNPVVAGTSLHIERRVAEDE